jgi:hypothetical protein
MPDVWRRIAIRTVVTAQPRSNAVKIKIMRIEGVVYEPTLMHPSDASDDNVIDVSPSVYDAWAAWKAQGEVIQSLLMNLCIRQRLEDEIADLKAERQALWTGKL